MRSIHVVRAAVIVCLLSGLTTAADAQVRFGVRAGEYVDLSEPFVGFELLIPVIGPHWYFNPNVEFVPADRGDLVSLNADLHYDFETGTILMPWVGGGLAVIRDDIGEDDTSLAGNVIGGLGFKTGTRLIPYVQLKAIVGHDHEDFVIMGGLRF